MKAGKAGVHRIDECILAPHREVRNSGSLCPAAMALGRRGGLKGGPARAAKMTPEERTESVRRAVLARWEKAKNGAA